MGTDAQAVAVPAMDGSREDPSERVGALFDAHYKRLFSLARRLVRDPDEAADLVQETFLRVARAPDRVPRGPSSEEAWLVRVLVNICKDSWRHAAVRVRAAAEGHVRPAEAVDPESGLLAHAMVWDALACLTPRRRAVVVLSELEGAPLVEIARLLGVTPVTVRWHLMRGRREMARLLGDNHD